MKDYVTIANQYIEDVLSGEIPACDFVKWACKRQKEDLEKPLSEDFPFRFNPTLTDAKGKTYFPAERICKFIELLPHIKGKWAKQKQLLTLEPWQIFILTTVFGWVDSKGNRRFKTVYTEVPRKNGKSSFSSGVALFGLSLDGEEGAEVYSAATGKEQARIVWGDAKKMVEKSAGIRHKLGVDTNAHSVYVEKTASVFKALSRDQGGNLDGLNIHVAVVDELHAHKTRDVWDVIETGTGSRDQPLVWAITTAGFNRAGICYEQRDYVIKLLQNIIIDDSYFGIIYTIDKEDQKERNWLNPDVWIKANPNWGVSVNPDDLKRLALKAKETPSAQNNFLTKRLNVWVNAGNAWMNMLYWDGCANKNLKLEDYKGMPGYMGLDLSTRDDLTAISIWVLGADDHLKLFNRLYLPEETIEENRNSQYEGWAKQGYIIKTDGNTIDFDFILQDVLDTTKMLDVRGIGLDPTQAIYLRTKLMEQGVETVELTQSFGCFNDPMNTFMEKLKNKSIEHEGNPAMAWMMSNVVEKVNTKGQSYPIKEFPQNKIDGPVSAMMGLRMFLDVPAIIPSVYETQGLTFL
jgi:phage terminase large subunit-like protein